MLLRILGQNGPVVSALGLGCMGMSAFYGKSDDEQSLRTLHHALDRGVNLLDTADMYGPHSNERLLSRLLRERRQEVVLATKFGIMLDPQNPAARGVNGHPDYVRSSCEASLQRLGVEVIDLYYQHRMDPNVPIEDTVGAMAELVQAGKVRYLGLSEASVATLERAHRVHPIHALQMEYSLWSRDAEQEHLAACARLGVGFVAYSPLGRGFLTGAIRRPEDFAEDDFRRTQPRFQGENFQHNLRLVEQIQQLAADKACSPAQLALAWVLAHGEQLIAIPGARKITNLEDNLGALQVSLSAAELAQIDGLFPFSAVQGSRYTEQAMGMLNI